MVGVLVGTGVRVGEAVAVHVGVRVTVGVVATVRVRVGVDTENGGQPASAASPIARLAMTAAAHKIVGVLLIFVSSACAVRVWYVANQVAG
jgi:hypothetical protein